MDVGNLLVGWRRATICRCAWKPLLDPSTIIGGGVGRQQQQQYGGNVLVYGFCYGFVCCEYLSFYFPHVVDVSALSICIVLSDFVVCEFGVDIDS